MDLGQRREELARALKEAETNSAYWTQRTYQLTGALVLLNEMIREAEVAAQAAAAPPSPQGDTQPADPGPGPDRRRRSRT
jgi:hypothetical protein